MSQGNKDFTQIPEISPFALHWLEALAELDVQELRLSEKMYWVTWQGFGSRGATGVVSVRSC